MDYAEVCVNSPAARRRTFTYSIPQGLEVVPGQAVFVPFGAQILQGIVLHLTAQPAVEQTKDIISIIEPVPLLSSQHLKLAEWISEYYICPLFDAAALMLPPGFERKVLTYLTASGKDFSGIKLSADQQTAIELVQKHGGTVGLAELSRHLGKKKALQAVLRLTHQHLLERRYELEPVKVKTKTERLYRLTVSSQQANLEAQKLKVRAKRQAELLEFLAGQSLPVNTELIKQNVQFNKSGLDALIKKCLVEMTVTTVRRNPLAGIKTNLSWPLPLTPSQSSAVSRVKAVLRKDNAEDRFPAVFLLYGVTGSGKTEVYLQALAESVKLGKRGIVLVPEIALTPQTIERFTARFPGRVAILHSQLSLGERFDEWTRIRNGEADVVIGPRSALFAPQPDLGLIIIDEEHEWSYKQSEKAPTYHTRTAAVRLANLTGAALILGSATPDVETFQRAKDGDYQLLELPERLVSLPFPGETADIQATVNPLINVMPEVDVVDMREELKTGNRSLFSARLHDAMIKALGLSGQVILFLNRRGASTFLQCRRCGFSFRCRRCDVPMTYHNVEDILICHQCNYKTQRPAACPRCRSPQIKFLGLGTEKLEQETAAEFPFARLLRWDGDTTRGWHAHQEILDKFRRHEADILIGTQMVSKGLDMPRVTLVGIINADTGLNLPDFRAGERTFQLLSQVAGRAGRGPMGGKVVIQTFSPEHYAVKAAAEHNYQSFFTQEIQYRRRLRLPPFTRLASLIFAHVNETFCRQEAERMHRLLLQRIAAQGVSGIDLVGPAPAFIHRRRGRFRWQLFVRGHDTSAFLAGLDLPAGWIIDVDPVGLN